MICKLEDSSCCIGNTNVNDVGARSAALQVIYIQGHVRLFGCRIINISRLFCHQAGFQTCKQEFRFSFIGFRRHIRARLIRNESILIIVNETIGKNTTRNSSASRLIVVRMEIDSHMVHQFFDDSIICIIFEIAIIL